MNVEEHFLAAQILVTEEVTYSQDEDGNIMILQHEAMNLAFQDGFDQGELNILRQFVQGKLDRDYILEMFGDKLGLSKGLKSDGTLPDRHRKVSMTEIRIENF